MKPLNTLPSVEKHHKSQSVQLLTVPGLRSLPFSAPHKWVHTTGELYNDSILRKIQSCLSPPAAFLYCAGSGCLPQLCQTLISAAAPVTTIPSLQLLSWCSLVSTTLHGFRVPILTLLWSKHGSHSLCPEHRPSILTPWDQCPAPVFSPT